VHFLLGISSIALFTFGSSLALRLLHGVGSWRHRRYVQCLVLSIPLASLGLGLVGLHHFTGRACLRDAPYWDSLVELAIPLGMGLIALGALCLGMLRLALMARVVLRRSISAGSDLQSLADDLAERLGAKRTRVRLCVYDRPLALTFGVFRPAILLSTWMVEALDRIRTLRSVLPPNMPVQVDGGIGPENIRSVHDAGATLFVAGTSIFGREDLPRAYRRLVQELS